MAVGRSISIVVGSEVTMKETIWFALLMFAAVFILYVYTCITENADNRRERARQSNNTSISARCSEEEFEANLRELKESMRGKK